MGMVCWSLVERGRRGPRVTFSPVSVSAKNDSAPSEASFQTIFEIVVSALYWIDAVGDVLSVVLEGNRLNFRRVGSD
jgi:hypothetical protein